MPHLELNVLIAHFIDDTKYLMRDAVAHGHIDFLKEYSTMLKNLNAQNNPLDDEDVATELLIVATDFNQQECAKFIISKCPTAVPNEDTRRFVENLKY